MSILTKLNNLCTYLGNKIKNLESRSNGSNIHYQLDTEILTGDIWIDNKDIYVYVFNEIIKTSTTSWSVLKDLSDLNIDKLITVIGTFERDNQEIYFYNYMSPTSQSGFGIYYLNNKLYHATTAAFYSGIVTFCVKYTKKNI